MELSQNQQQRYRRHLILEQVGEAGQKKISSAKVLVIGAGGLGSPVLLYLAAAGVGTLGVADSDVVDLSNLQRQVIHATPDVDRGKVASACEKINRLNPDVTVRRFEGQVNAANILEMIAPYDMVVDATDNFPSKFLINDACVIAGKPFSHAGVLQMVGQTMTVLPGQSACYRCVFSEPPAAEDVPSCSQVGLLGTLPGVLGTLQATEVLKYILGQGELLTNRLLIFDALDMEFRTVQVATDENCRVCGADPQITTPVDM